MDLSVSMQAMRDLFTFPFRDPRWPSKLGIGAALGLASLFLPVIPWLPLAGYFARLIRAGAENADPAILPEWDRWDDLFLDGLRLLGAGLIFSLPALLVLGAGWLLYFGTTFTMPFLQNTRAQGPMVLAFMLSLIVFFFSLGIGSLLGVLAAVVSPAAVAHVAVTRRFAALGDVNAWWAILRANFVGFLLALGAFLMLYLVGIAIMQLLYFTIVLCLFGPLLAMPVLFYAGVILYRLTGQAYREARARLAANAAAVEAAPPSGTPPGDTPPGDTPPAPSAA